jgi:hypothetical protein
MTNCGSILLLVLFGVALSQFNHTLWENVVKRHGRLGFISGVSLNVVDYTSIHKDAQFSEYLDVLRMWPVNGTVNDRQSLYINAYNAWAIKLVMDNACKVRFGKYCW